MNAQWCGNDSPIPNHSAPLCVHCASMLLAVQSILFWNLRVLVRHCAQNEKKLSAPARVGYIEYYANNAVHVTIPTPQNSTAIVTGLPESGIKCWKLLLGYVPDTVSEIHTQI